jgi:Heparinase II/III-like protein/Heparinase II/III N-terminus
LSGLSWKLRRLRAMSLGEIAHRVGIGLRDRLTPAAYELWTPPEAFGRLFADSAEQVIERSWLARLVRDTGPGHEATLAAARRLLEGRWPLFGSEVRLDDPPDWNRNYRIGAAWPDRSSEKLDYRRSDVAGGVKLTWELGRLTMLPTLALAARASGEPAFAERCGRWLADWNEQNPLGHGIHHASGIEMAIRVLTVNWTLALIGDRLDPTVRAATLGLLAQQALHCRDHLSLGSSANNHLLSEYAAMTLMGAMHPSLDNAASLLDRGLAGLERETLLQIHPDGVPGEQAFGYLPFIWELLLLPFVAAEAAGRTVAPAVRARLATSLEFARAMRLPNGRLPSIGDEDDARVLLAEIEAPRLDLVGNALAVWLAGPSSAAGPGAPGGLAPDHDDLARLLFGGSPSSPPPPREGEAAFETGGYHVWRAGERLITFDHGPLGYGPLAAHGHADALAITLHVGATPVIADPGTFAYHADAAARDRCRSTPVHATVHFGGRSQSEMLGPFLWGRRARVRELDGGHLCQWWTGERHWRSVIVQPGALELVDRVEGPSAFIAFPLAPHAVARIDGTTVTIEIPSGIHGPITARLNTEGAGAWRVESAEHASNFGRLEQASRLIAPITAREARTRIDVTR